MVRKKESSIGVQISFTFHYKFLYDYIRLRGFVLPSIDITQYPGNSLFHLPDFLSARGLTQIIPK